MATSRKELIIGDFLFDDKYDNVDKWLLMWDRVHDDGHQRGLLWANQPHHEQHELGVSVGSRYGYMTSWQQLLDHVADVVKSTTPICGRDFH